MPALIKLLSPLLLDILKELLFPNKEVKNMSTGMRILTLLVIGLLCITMFAMEQFFTLYKTTDSLKKIYGNNAIECSVTEEQHLKLLTKYNTLSKEIQGMDKLECPDTINIEAYDDSLIDELAICRKALDETRRKLINEAVNGN